MTAPKLDGLSKGLLRIATAGSVDDGKSTLIGRMLYDAGLLPEDQIEALRRAAERDGQDDIDLSLLTDGLSAEREQGITIDVAYRYFATAARKYILADSPGHEQYTRNMVTAASTAEAAIILVDAGKGMTDQTKRHIYLANLLGVRRLLVAVNKMDLVGFTRDAFDRVGAEVAGFCKKISAEPILIPLSAKLGDNVVHSSQNMPWYKGQPLLAVLESLPTNAETRPFTPLRFPVQFVGRHPLPDGRQKRLYMGRVETGSLRVGDSIYIAPDNNTSRITAIWQGEQHRTHASAPHSVAIEIADEIDIARGDLISHKDRAPRVANRFEASICWFADQPFDPRRRYLLKCGTRQMSMKLSILYRLNVVSLTQEPGVKILSRNDIAHVKVTVSSPLGFDFYRDNRATGAFIIIDEQSNATAAAGMIEPPIDIEDAEDPLMTLADGI